MKTWTSCMTAWIGNTCQDKISGISTLRSWMPTWISYMSRKISCLLTLKRCILKQVVFQCKQDAYQHKYYANCMLDVQHLQYTIWPKIIVIFNWLHKVSISREIFILLW